LQQPSFRVAYLLHLLALQKLPIDFAAIIFGQRADELNPARIFVKGQTCLDELLDILSQSFVRILSFA
jgi:hypothetical protein